MAILTSGLAVAQNANRHGFFIEAGVGGLVGNTPRTSISVVDNVMYYKCLSGAVADFGLGGRFRIGNQWAYETKAEVQISFTNPINALVGRVLPIGFRFTSVEFWRNYSIYAHLNLGAAITGNSGIIGRENLISNSKYMTIYPNTTETDIKGYVGMVSYGIAYSTGVGVNITTHLYLEGCFSAQTLFSCFGKNGKGIINYGIVSCVIGYRF